MTFSEIIKKRSTEDLNEAAKELLSRLNDTTRGGCFDGSAVCFAVPLSEVIAEIAGRKRYRKPSSEAEK